MQGQASTAAYQANTILNPAYPEMPDGATRVTAGNRRKLRYFRIDGPLRRNYDDPLQGPNDALDDAGPDNIVALKAFAAALIKKHTMALDEMVERIVAVFKN